MPKLNQIASVTENPQLIGLFKVAIKRQVFLILAQASPPAALLAWAKRARLQFRDDRSDFYATLVLEGALNENAAFRTAVDAALENPSQINFPDAAFAALVDTWVQRFAIFDI